MNTKEDAPISINEFKKSMRFLAGAVTIIATNGKGGKGGLTATAVCSVSDAPPTLLVCINKENEVSTMITTNSFFSVNLLADYHEFLSNRFAGYIAGITQEERFNEGNWDTFASGSPQLTDSMVSFDCRVKQRLEEGSHYIFLGEIIAVSALEDVNEIHPLLYFNQAYQQLK